MHVDFLIKTWERIYIPEEMREEVLEKLKAGEITTANDIYDLESAQGNESLSREVLDNTEQSVTLDENNGYNTIEVYGEEDTPIFHNGKRYID
jgi:hypothetical protein